MATKKKAKKAAKKPAKKKAAKKKAAKKKTAKKKAVKKPPRRKRRSPLQNRLRLRWLRRLRPRPPRQRLGQELP
jgi:hypothetical protein